MSFSIDKWHGGMLYRACDDDRRVEARETEVVDSVLRELAEPENCLEATKHERERDEEAGRREPRKAARRRH